MILAMKMLGHVVQASELLSHWRSEFALASGCFDLLHRGHVELLRAIASQTKLPVVVAVNSDASIRRLKGPKRPICRADDRMFMLANLQVVAGVCWFAGNDASEVITFLKPKVWAKGSDYSLKSLTMNEKRAARRVGTKIVFVKRVGDWSTTGILKKI